jgi:hypothetical protein
MHVSTASSEANLACAVPTPNDFSKLSTSQPVAPTRATIGVAPGNNRPIRLALLVAGMLLAAVSIALAGQAGWQRGVSILESAIWCAAGISLAIVSLTGLSAALGSHGTMRRAALAAWALSLAFVIVSQLGSQHSGRELATRVDSATTGDRARHEAAYKRASDELAALPAARPSAVVETELATILNDSRLKGCAGWLESRRLRTICVERVEPLRAEQSVARERQRLQTAMDDATAALAAAKPATPANSDATAVARYLAAVGIVVGVDRLADLISLLTVVAIEVVGAVAIALGRQQSMLEAPSAQQAATADSSPNVNSGSVAAPIRIESTATDKPADCPSPKGGPAVGNDADRRRDRIVKALMAGAVEGTQERIADSLGVPKTTMRRIVESDPRLRLSVGQHGSRLELVGA